MSVESDLGPACLEHAISVITVTVLVNGSLPLSLGLSTRILRALFFLESMFID